MTIGNFCKSFRTEVLNLRLKDLAPDTVGTLSAFELGSSTNMNHLLTYYKAATNEQRTVFMGGLKNALEEIANGN